MQNLTEEELTELRNSKSEVEWNAVCDKIKKARGGQYWWPKVQQSGLAYQVQKNWK